MAIQMFTEILPSGAARVEVWTTPEGRPPGKGRLLAAGPDLPTAGSGAFAELLADLSDLATLMGGVSLAELGRRITAAAETKEHGRAIRVRKEEE